MKLTIVYAEELFVSPVDIHNTGNNKTSVATLCVDVPNSHVNDFTLFGLDVISMTRPSPEKVYAPSEWIANSGTNVVKLNNFNTPDIEYLRYCHKAIETYKLFCNSDVREDMCSILLPPFSICRVILYGGLEKWNRLVEKWMGHKNKLYSEYASKIIPLVKK